jgi:hypothetical protein
VSVGFIPVNAENLVKTAKRIIIIIMSLNTGETQCSLLQSLIPVLNHTNKLNTIIII